MLTLNPNLQTLFWSFLAGLGAWTFHFLFNGTHSLWILIPLASLAPIFSHTRVRIPLLILLSWGHLFWVLERNAHETLLPHWQGTLFLIPIMVSLVFILIAVFQKIPLTWQAPTFIAICSLLAIFNQGIEIQNSPKLTWALSLMVWPLTLYFADENRSKVHVPWWRALYSIFPAWSVRLYHNIPTEPGPTAFSESRDENREVSQKEGNRILWLAVVVLAFKLLFMWVCYGGRLFNMEFLEWNPPWLILRQISFPNPTTPLLTKVFSIYVFFTELFLHFALLGLLANGIARLWGYRFPINSRIEFGSQSITQWNTLFYYFNLIIVKVFYYPLLRALKFIRHRRVRNSFALVLAVYGFGFSYLLFIQHSHLFSKEGWSSVAGTRAVYLALVSIFGLIRIWGPKQKKRPWLHRLAPFIYFLILCPLFAIGMMSLVTYKISP